MQILTYNVGSLLCEGDLIPHYDVNKLIDKFIDWLFYFTGWCTLPPQGIPRCIAYLRCFWRHFNWWNFPILIPNIEFYIWNWTTCVTKQWIVNFLSLTGCKIYKPTKCWKTWNLQKAWCQKDNMHGKDPLRELINLWQVWAINRGKMASLRASVISGSDIKPLQYAPNRFCSIDVKTRIKDNLTLISILGFNFS